MPPISLTRYARQIFSDLTPVGAPSGWATTSMIRSIRDVVFVMMAGWQGVMVVATLTALGVGGWPLALAQAMLAAAALLARTHRRLAPALPFAMIALSLCTYLASDDLDSLMALAASWQTNFASCAAVLLILRPIVVPGVIGSAIVLATGVVTAIPGWGLQPGVSIAVTQTAIVVALRLGLPSLLRIASDTDRAAEAADAARAHAALVREVTVQSAEQARVLHDTAINTLAAVATGGPATRDGEMVRSQCARDVALLDALRAEAPLPETRQLGEVFMLPGLPIRRSGVDDATIAHLTEQLPAAVIAAAVGCVQESVTNATKHSGAEAVSIDVTDLDGDIVITVADDGVGFTSDTAQERGIAASIRQRAHEHGIDVELTSVLGIGTRVVLTVRTSGGPTEATVPPPSTDELKNGAARLWGVGVAVVSIVLMLTGGTNTDLALVPMIVLMLAAVVVARRPVRARARVPLAVILIALTLAVFTLSAAAVGFGRIGPMHWQALAATGPFVLFLSLRLSQRAIAAGMLAWGVTAVVLAAAVWPDDAVAGQMTLVAGAVGLGFAAVWLRFQTAAARHATDAAHLLDETFRTNLRTELDLATRQTYRRWSDAGLDVATDLLRTIADGSRTAQDPDVRRACADEERYLRQLLQVSPSLLLLGPRLLPALRTARERDVPFTMRVGDVDARDDEVATRISGTVMNAVEVTPAGAACSVSIFPIGDDLQLTVIAPSPPPATVHAAEHRIVTAGTLTIAEYIYPAATMGERTSVTALTSGSTR